MKIHFFSHYLLSAIFVLVSSAIANAATSNWTGTDGGSGSWATVSTTAPTPGWDSALAPNAAGDVAQFVDPITTANVTTVQDTGAGVIVGTINYGNHNDMGDFSWTITNTNGITLDQDGAGAGFATISNSSTNASTGNAIAISTGTITLADNLHVLNTTTGSTNVNGSIQLGSIIAGTGNLVLNSSQPIDAGMTNTSVLGAIRLTGANTFVGGTTIERGLVAFTTANAFGNTANTIQLGVAGADSATLVRQGTATATITNPIAIPAGNTGALTFGSVHTANVAVNYNGTISLESDANVIGRGAANTAAVNLNGLISGSGGLTKVGVGFVQIFNAANSYSGDTIINEGTVVAVNAIPDGPGKGNVFVASGATLVTGSSSEVINGLSGSGIVTTSTGGSRTLTVGGNDATSTFSGSMQNITTGTPRTFTLAKTGAGTLTLSGTNTYTGATTINGGALQFAQTASLYNNNTLPAAGTGWVDTRLRVNTGASAAFNVGGTGEFTAADIDILKALGAAATNSGFGDGSSIGLDTTNAAGGEFVYGSVIANTNAGANNVGLTKLGTNTLTLTGVSTYTGPTTVAGGLLNVDTTGSIDTSPTINVKPAGSLLANHILTTTLNLEGSATVRADGGAAGASKVETLNVSTGGQLNLKNNDLVVGTGILVDVRSQIKLGLSGVNNTAAAAGITSDMMTASVHGFGYASGSDANRSPLIGGPGAGGTLSGQTYDADSVIIKFTYRGDADLDGDSDLDDLGFWANSFTGDLGLGPVAVPTTLWTQGDWDYDGDTDLDDLGFWSSTFTGDLGGGGLSVYAPNASEGAIAALGQMGITAVPEPGSVATIGIGFTGIALRSLRRRNQPTRS